MTPSFFHPKYADPKQVENRRFLAAFTLANCTIICWDWYY